MLSLRKNNKYDINIVRIEKLNVKNMFSERNILNDITGIAHPDYQELKGDSGSKRLNSLMEFGDFKSEEDAMKFLENIDAALLEQEHSEEIIKEFSDNFQAIVREAMSQLKKIEAVSGGELADKEKMLKNILLGIGENFDYLKPEIEKIERKKGFSLVDIPMKLGNFVKHNKAAFAAFGVFSVLARMGGGEAEASEAIEEAVDIPDDIQAVFAESLEQFGEELEFAEKIEEKDPEIDIIIEKIKEAKENPGAMYSRINSESNKFESSIDVDLIQGEIKKGGLKLDVKGVFILEDSVERGISSHFVSNELVFAPAEGFEQDKHNMERQSPKDFLGIGETREEAIAQAMEGAAKLRSVEIESVEIDMETHADSSEAGNYFKQSIRTAVDETIYVTEIDIQEKITSNHGGNGKIIYEARITSR